MREKLFLTVLCVLLAASTSGCLFLAAGAAGAGTAKWLSEKVTAELDQPSMKVVKAAKSTFEDLKIQLDKESATNDVVQLLAKYTDGKQVWVDVRPVASNRTKLEVRVGRMDGDAEARALLDKIVKKANSWLL